MVSSEKDTYDSIAFLSSRMHVTKDVLTWHWQGNVGLEAVGMPSSWIHLGPGVPSSSFQHHGSHSSVKAAQRGPYLLG